MEINERLISKERLVSITLTIVLVASLLFLCGCVSYKHRAYRDQTSTHVDSAEYILRYVEADDEGWFWHPQQAKDAIETVESSADKTDTFVIVFVHGWHHSAECCDSNVEGFRETLV